MRYVFLTACRNEAKILEQLLSEFSEMLESAGIATATLYVVDDLSMDHSVEVLERSRARGLPFRLEIIRAPTNLGNQGALFYGLSRVAIHEDDTLITFDSDGEDDVREIPSILKMGRENPGKVILIERGRRKESFTFRTSFTCYKLLFRYLTRQAVIPNNFLLLPGRFVPTIRRSPLAAVHFAYAILKIRFPAVITQRDRRARYGGQTSQSLFMLASHGLVGLMVFYETVIAKLLLLLILFGAFSLGVGAAALAVPLDLSEQRVLLWCAMAAGGLGLAFFGLLLASALALIFKLSVFTLTRVAAEAPEVPMSRRAAVSEVRDAALHETAGNMPS